MRSRPEAHRQNAAAPNNVAATGDSKATAMPLRTVLRSMAKRMLGFREPAQGCDTHQSVALDVVRRPKPTPVRELEQYMRCKDCSEVRGYAFKRSHLVALRQRKISTSDPPSTWWPGER